MVPPDSHGISGVPCYSGQRTRVAVLRIRDYHPLRSAFPDCSTSTTIDHSSPVRQNQQCDPTTPPTQRLPAITRERFSLIRFRSPLLSESLLFSLPVGTEMFHFPTFPPHALCVQAPVTGLSSSWVSPFGHPRINARLPTPQGLSQAPTSFIGSRCQGIHHVLLVACRHKDARVHCEVLKTQPETHPPTHAHPRPPNPGPSQAHSTTHQRQVRGMSSPTHQPPRNQPRPHPTQPPTTTHQQATMCDPTEQGRMR